MFVAITLFATVAPAEEYKAIFWNLESGESKAETIADQMAAKGAIDFWGLSEVPDQEFLDKLTAKITAVTNINYKAKLSEDPSTEDKLAIIFNADRLTSEPYSGNHPVDDIEGNFFEVETVRLSSGLRPSLGIQLKDDSGQSVVVLVNHFKAFDSDSSQSTRKRQAEATDVFVAQTPGLPIVIAGDLNMHMQAGGSGLTEPAFAILDQLCDYLEPVNGGVASTFRSGSTLDAVWVANDLTAYDSHTTILNRRGNEVASNKYFSDSNDDTDHRPLLLTIIFADPDERIEALREDIALLEETLARMKQTLTALEAAQDEDE